MLKPTLQMITDLTYGSFCTIQSGQEHVKWVKTSNIVILLVWQFYWSSDSQKILIKILHRQPFSNYFKNTRYESFCCSLCSVVNLVRIKSRKIFKILLKCSKQTCWNKPQNSSINPLYLHGWRMVCPSCSCSATSWLPRAASPTCPGQSYTSPSRKPFCI